MSRTETRSAHQNAAEGKVGRKSGKLSPQREREREREREKEQ